MHPVSHCAARAVGLSLAVLWLAAALAAEADEIAVDGKPMSGKVVKVTPKGLEVETTYGKGNVLVRLRQDHEPAHGRALHRALRRRRRSGRTAGRRERGRRAARGRGRGERQQRAGRAAPRLGDEGEIRRVRPAPAAQRAALLERALRRLVRRHRRDHQHPQPSRPVSRSNASRSRLTSSRPAATASPRSTIRIPIRVATTPPRTS